MGFWKWLKGEAEIARSEFDAVAGQVNALKADAIAMRARIGLLESKALAAVKAEPAKIDSAAKAVADKAVDSAAAGLKAEVAKLP